MTILIEAFYQCNNTSQTVKKEKKNTNNEITEWSVQQHTNKTCASLLLQFGKYSIKQQS